ncbi:hypothetical protein P152DRAFT_447102 [Eremomyces bilateralis CBS 781.70]|uniref:Uncharacterized protein n=1 Tax=Eremomyces bilateralis CBS 781.70 TaxID=1392243 RepID=A0A6G1GA69_9PEZI|nr:uncharacterized protein P152DRAFT_447102 [Eremomyces bilateralis CBS 781.70]KAF1814801.1 hypothetical protein P152DRAFT_447102 [Eremomyces bilateralis CBS 781.70]
MLTDTEKPVNPHMTKRSRAARKRNRHIFHQARQDHQLGGVDVSTQTEQNDRILCSDYQAPLPLSRYPGGPNLCTEPAHHLREVIALLHGSDRRSPMPWFPGQRQDWQARRCIRVYKHFERKMEKMARLESQASSVIMRTGPETPSIEPYVSDELLAEFVKKESESDHPVEPYISDELLAEYLETKRGHPARSESEFDFLDLCSDLLSSPWLSVHDVSESSDYDNDDIHAWKLLAEIPESTPCMRNVTREEAISCKRPESDGCQVDDNAARTTHRAAAMGIDDWWGWH